MTGVVGCSGCPVMPSEDVVAATAADDASVGAAEAAVCICCGCAVAKSVGSSGSYGFLAAFILARTAKVSGWERFWFLLFASELLLDSLSDKWLSSACCLCL